MNRQGAPPTTSIQSGDSKFNRVVRTPAQRLYCLGQTGGPYDMLGEQIGEETGKVTSFRVTDAAGPKVEVSFPRGKILGIDYQGRGTYSSQMQTGRIPLRRGPGHVHDCRWRRRRMEGSGHGKTQSGRRRNYRGAIYFMSASGKLAKLLGTVGVFEHGTDAADNVTSKLWEWK